MKTRTSFKKGHKPTYTAQGEEHHQYRHGMYGTPLYKKWEAMKRRCLNKNEKSYKNYGGRGITICKEWLNFMGFYNDVYKGYKNGLSLERIDNNKGYYKENCKWITMAEQAKNRRNVDIYELNGIKLIASDWDKKLGLKMGTVKHRINYYKWPLERALTLKKFERNKTT